MTLDPLAEALLADVRAESERAVAAARSKADEVLETARADAEALLDAARAEGESSAQADLDRSLADARRAAARSIQEARNGALSGLRAGALKAVQERCQGPDYEAFLDQLVDVAKAQLGPTVRVTRGVPGAGGVIAEAEGRLVDYTLPALVDRCLGGLGVGAEELWR